MVSLFRSQKKGEDAVSRTGAPGSALLVLMVAFLIILYILFLPPSDREALLEGGALPGERTGLNSYISSVGTTPLQETIGKLTAVTDPEIEHNLQSFRIYTTTDSKLIEEISSIYIKNSAFGREFGEFSFNVDRNSAENMLLSFNIARSSGRLVIYFNGEQIFAGELGYGTPPPISLPKSLLKSENTISFAVSSPGVAFWRVNEYLLETVRVTGDLTDSSHSFTSQKLYLANEEIENFDNAVMSFFPDCNPSSVGVMNIFINNNNVFRGIPDCNIRNYVDLGKAILNVGENNLEFTSTAGSYIVDMLKVEVKLKTPDYPIYYFMLDEDLFVDVANEDVVCGKVDGICPENCQLYEDKDCCYGSSRNYYWCDMPTDNVADRCVNSVQAGYCERCLSGYEDRHQDPPDSCAGRCGDDTDEYCPGSCPLDYDEDCCFAENEENYWCSDMPSIGLYATCTPSVSPSQCDTCPNDYRQEDGSRPQCPYSSESDASEELKVNSNVDVIMEVRFVDDSFKKMDVYINGVATSIEGYKSVVYRNVNDYVHDGTNTIKIVPLKDVEISSLRIKIE